VRGDNRQINSLMHDVKVGLLGFGNVGRAFAEYVGRMSGARIRLHIRAVADSSGGLFIENDEPLQRIIDHKAAGRPIRDYAASSMITGPRAFIDRLSSSGVRVLVESLPTNLQDGQPALDLIKAALAAGINVVTVDKGPLVHGFEALQQAARASGARLGFTGTTGVSIPDDLAGERLLEIRGVLNGTTNYILTEMQQRGVSFNEALSGAQASGIAEPDPSLDVDGWDTVVKTLILAKALMNANTRLDEVTRIGINAETDELIRIGRETNRVVRLVGRARLYQGRVRVSVVPKLIAADSPFYAVSGTSKLAVFRTASKREVISTALSGRDAIAQAMVDDIVKITSR
jgi:homoserine dehydrogenase